MATNDKKISNLVERQLPEFVQASSPALLEFVKKYYTLLESAQMTITNIGAIDNILLETEVTSFLQLNATDEFGNDANDYIVDEQSGKGEFVKGEIITGQTSGQTATILAEDVDNGKLYVSANSKFITGEEIVGATSSATATINKYRANPVENITNLLEYVDVDDTISDFFIQFRNKFLDTVPNNLDGGLNKEAFTKRIIDLYRAKGTSEATKLFFRALLDEEAEIIYPNRDMLRVSDGKWETKTILKVILVTPVGGSISNLSGQTITQQIPVGNTVVPTASAVVDLVETVQIGNKQISTLFLQEGSVRGTFVSSNGDNLELEDATDTGDLLLETGDTIDLETQVFITGIDNTDSDVVITCSIEQSIETVTVVRPGSYFETNDVITVDNSTSIGEQGNVVIDAVGEAPITDIRIESGGQDYAVGDSVAVNNTDTGGDFFAAEVSVINGGFLLENFDDDSIILDEDGGVVVMESATNSDLNDITKIKITNFGEAYTKLPTLTVTSTNGTGVEIFAVSSQVGRILSTRTLNNGFRYDTPPLLSTRQKIQVNNLSGNFTIGETVTMNETANIIFESGTLIHRVDEGRVRLEDSRQSQILDEDGSPLLIESATDTVNDNAVFSLEDSEPVVQIKNIQNISPVYNLQFESISAPISNMVGTSDTLTVTTSSVHHLSTGQTVKFFNVGGMTEVNGNNYTITVTSSTEFTIAIDASGFSAYTSGGTAENNGDYIQTQTPLVDVDNKDILYEDDDTMIADLSIATGTVVEYDSQRNILTIDSVTGEFVTGQILTGNSSGVTADIAFANPNELTTTVDTIVTTTGEFTNVDGHVSETTKRIQDSFYYQDYSYVVRVGEVFQIWRDDLKRSIHPSGFEVFGEVAIKTRVDAQIKKGFTLLNGFQEGDIISLLDVIFAEKIGRRLGITSSTKTKRTNAHLGIEQDESFDANTFDVELTTKKTISFNPDEKFSYSVRGTTIHTGFANLGGARIGNIEKYKFGLYSNTVTGTGSATTVTDPGVTIGSINTIVLTGTRNTSLDGETVQLRDIANSPRMRMNFALPTTVTTSS